MEVHDFEVEFQTAYCFMRLNYEVRRKTWEEGRTIRIVHELVADHEGRAVNKIDTHDILMKDWQVVKTKETK